MFKRIISILMMLIIFIGTTSYRNMYSYAAYMSETITDVGVIYAWTNSSGQWIWAKDLNGNDVLPIPRYAGGGSITYTFKRQVPSQFVGKITGVKSVEYNSSSSVNPSAVKREHVTIQPSYQFGNDYVMFTVTLRYLESNDFDGMGNNVKQAGQAELVEGREFHVPTKITFEYMDNMDTITAKYQDTAGRTIKAFDGYAPNKEGYFPVFAANIQGYDLISHPAGKQDIWIGKTGKNHEVIFIYKLQEGQEPAPDPEGDIWVKINVPSLVEEDRNFDVKQTSDSTYPITKIEWFQNKSHVKAHDGKFDGYRTKISYGQYFGVRITDSKGNTAFDEKYVDVTEYVEPAINANLIFGPQRPHEISLEDYLANKEQEIRIWVSGEHSTYTNTELGHFYFFADITDESIRKYEGNESAALNDPNFIERVTINTREDPESLIWDAYAMGTFKFLPQDPVITASLLLRSRYVNGPVGFATAYHTVELDVDSIPPETELTIPYPFYPKEIDNLDQKTITWTYHSEQNIPYKYSIVSLYKLENRGNGITRVPVFEDRIMTERKLIVQGEAEENYIIEVEVVDTLNKRSSTAMGPFTIIGAVPIIDIELDNKTNPDVLEIEVFNKTPKEIEELFPTSYSYWTIHDSKGNLVVEGDGEAPKSVNLDERFDRGKYTVTQHAINTIGATAKASKDFEIVSYINFVPNPATQFEDDMIELIDLSKYIVNKSWYIRGNDEIEFSNLELNPNNEFTRDEGRYQVKLRGTGYFPYVGDEEREVIKTVIFLSTKPTAGLLITSNKKEYKRVTLNGLVSVDSTNAQLQAKYPIDFDHELTQFKVAPLDGIGGSVDYSKNEYIHGEGKEEIDGVVTFRGKGLQDIRIDKEGWYRVSYKVYNGRKESDWVAQEIYISPELPITVDINVDNSIVYRDPGDQLKSKLDVTVTYNTADDEIDQDLSRLFIEYQENGVFTEEVNRTYWIGNNNNNLPNFMELGQRIFEGNQAKFALYVDSEDKNLFGHFRFNFEAIEKPSIPNFDDPMFPGIPIITANTFLIDDKKKMILVDNNKPYIELETSRENTVEIWIIEESNKPLDVDKILSDLKLNRIKAKLYIIKQDGTVEIME